MESRLQRDQTTQQLWVRTACDIRRIEWPVNWPFNAKQQDQHRDLLILQASDF